MFGEDDFEGATQLAMMGEGGLSQIVPTQQQPMTSQAWQCYATS